MSRGNESYKGHGLSSLIGGSGISLDGRSLQIPDDVSDIPDEVSSINSSIYRLDHMRVGSPVELMRAGGGENSQHPFQEQSQGDTFSRSNSNKEQTQATAPVPDREEERSLRKLSYLPIWIIRAPTWLKLAVLVSVALLVGAVVLVTVGVSLALHGDGSQQSLVAERPPAPVAETRWTVGPAAPQAPVNSPSAPPVGSPTAAPTSAPTAPVDLEEIKFYLIAGRYQGDSLNSVPYHLHELPKRFGTSFLVHMGDWNSPEQTNCDEASFQEVASFYQNSSVPVYFVVGDNEYNGEDIFENHFSRLLCLQHDCSLTIFYIDCRNPAEALGFWKTYLSYFHLLYWPIQEGFWVRSQDKGNEEDFTFLYKGSVFASINLVAGTAVDAVEFQARLLANLNYIDQLYRIYRKDASIFFLFAHAEVPGEGDNAGFYQSLFQVVSVDYSDMHFVIVNRGGVASQYGIQKAYLGITNLDVITVIGPFWPPLEVTVNTREKKNPSKAVSVNLN
jgi:hypothetical protein